MSYVLLEENTVVAAKRHTCIWCGHHIAIGESYTREKSVYCGNFQNFAWHPECKEAQQDECSAYGDEEFIAYGNERPAPAVPL